MVHIYTDVSILFLNLKAKICSSTPIIIITIIQKENNNKDQNQVSPHIVGCGLKCMNCITGETSETFPPNFHTQPDVI